MDTLTVWVEGEPAERELDGVWFACTVCQITDTGIQIQYPEGYQELLCLEEAVDELRRPPAPRGQEEDADEPIEAAEDKDEETTSMTEPVPTEVAPPTPIPDCIQRAIEQQRLAADPKPESDLSKRCREALMGLQEQQQSLRVEVERLEGSAAQLQLQRDQAAAELLDAEEAQHSAAAAVSATLRTAPPPVHDNGMWMGEQAAAWHFHDESLAAALCLFLQGHTVIDLGCGMGHYVSTFRTNGIEAVGVDGNPSTRSLAGEHCMVADLTSTLPASLLRDWVVSLEVAEHIPAEHEQPYLANLASLSGVGVILSWATPGQGGLGHVNEQPNDYAISRMEALGFQYDAEASTELRSAAEIEWFKSTILVFRKVEPGPAEC